MVPSRLFSNFYILSLFIAFGSISDGNSFSVSFHSPDGRYPESASSSLSSEEVEDYKVIYSNSRGSPISNKIHEDDKLEELREILCPGSKAVGGLLRYDLNAGKCSEIDSQGHCGRNMIFKEELDSSSYGYCECDFESHSVPLVYHKQSRSCYPIYQQGYCRPGQWLVFSQIAKGPVCETNRCLTAGLAEPRVINRRSKIRYPESWEIDESRPHRFVDNSNSKLHLVPLNGSGACVPLDKPSKFCEIHEKVIISSDDIFPRCGVPGKSVRRLSIIANACPPGSYYSIIGYCQPVWDF